MCLYSTSLPVEVFLRVWDALLLEGSKVLHRLALALLALCEQQLMRHDNAGAGRARVRLLAVSDKQEEPIRRALRALRLAGL